MNNCLQGRRNVLRALPAAAIASSVFTICLLWPDPAFAQVGATLDNAVDAMQATLVRGGARLAQIAQQLLLFLLVIDFVWRGGKWLISNQSVAEFVEPMLYTIGIVTMAWAFATQVPVVVRWIADSAAMVASHAQPGGSFSPNDLRPGGMMARGLNQAVAWVGMVGMSPSTWTYLICAFVSVIVLGGVLTLMILAYAELYIVSMIGVITLGFAGLSQTRGVATRYVMSLFGKGFKLMTLLLLVDATERLAREATRTAGGATFQGALSAIMLQVIGAGLIMILPSAVERLVGGSAVGDTSGGATKVAGALASGGAATAGAVAGGAVGAAGGAAKGAWQARKEGGKAVAKAAGIDAVKGAWNWGGAASQGKVRERLASRIGGRVNRLGTGGPKGGAEGGS